MMGEITLICTEQSPSTFLSYHIISMSKRFYASQILLDKRFLNLSDMDSLLGNLFCMS